MTNIIVVGAQWGDEGKAKVVDLLAEAADVVVRCQGGCNAGHTVVHEGRVFKFHLIPSGMLYPDKLCVVGPGTVIDPAVLLAEIDAIRKQGYNVENLRISDRAHVTLPYHILQDRSLETSRAESRIGTTGRGIGPTYMDKVGRIGIRVGDLFEPEERLIERLTQVLAFKAPQLANICDNAGAVAGDHERGGEDSVDSMPTLEALLPVCKAFAEALAPFVADTVPLLHQAMADGRHILFEGAQGTLLDIDYGTYPYVTSSNATAGGACTGSGIGPTRMDGVVGVMKAYTTRVGEGPFPTELNNETGRHLQEVGQEFGTTTGRLRRCGWFDTVIARYSAQVNGLDSVALTKLDVLDGLTEIKLCTAYRNKKTGEWIRQFPSQPSVLTDIEPVYEVLSGWSGTVRGARRYEDLPAAAQRYLERIEALIETPIDIIGVGPERQETLVIRHPMAQKTENRDGKPEAAKLRSKSPLSTGSPS